MTRINSRYLQTVGLIIFTAVLTRIAELGPVAGLYAAGPIDNYYNVEHYVYSSGGGRDASIVRLKDCEYSFWDNIDIPGMPDTKEDDFLNRYIFSEAQCPQGICLTDEYVLITSYSEEESCKGELMVIDRESGDYLATLGMDEKSHLGGIAYDGANVWVCNSSNQTVERISYDFIRLMADANRKGVVDATDMVDEFEVKNKPSCITYYGGRLWIATHTMFFTSKLVAYQTDADNTALEALGDYRIPPKVQGIAFGTKGEVWLSTSYGRRASSYLKKYSSLVALSSHPRTPSLQIEMPPCSEEIDEEDGCLYVIFESAGEKYYEGTDGKGKSLAPIDRILEIKRGV